MTQPNPDAAITQAIIGLPMRLRAHRAARRLSLRDVATATGVNHGTLCRIEAGDNYTVDNLILIAAYLDQATQAAPAPDLGELDYQVLIPSRRELRARRKEPTP